MKKLIGQDDDSTFTERTIVSPIAAKNPVSREQMPAILVISGPNIGRSFSIDKEEFMIGRVDNCDLVVDDDLVSRHHCKFVVTKDGTTIVDLASTNGTLLNGHRVERNILKEGDQIQVGSSTIFKFHLQEEVERKFLLELYNAATKDFLTGAFGKKYFMDRLSSEFFYIQRNAGQFALLILDLDFFKKVNDTYGHLAGDLTLKKIAQYLITNTRKHDLVARFGGEEFVIFMRECDLTQAQALAEHLRVGISNLQLEFNGRSFQVTASIGIATMNDVNRDQYASVDGIIDLADSHLYEAKNTGRNKICF
jgi:two-component system cell cycle response regulator